MELKRGEIYYIARGGYGSIGSEQESGRPGIIVSNDALNRTSGTVEIVYLTTQPKRDEPTHVTIRTSGKVSTALCEQVTTVSIDRIGDLFGICSKQELDMIDIAISDSLGLTTLSPTVQSSRGRYDERAAQTIAQLKAECETYKNLYNGILDRVMAR